ncbi:protein phosphatase 2C domain-containing protein [Streptomyces sp. GC420]|uniref:protein phosphatase 2C domain-containing protein n=1 Tax=Streptomyces sp. GC420 TaxID=2697568 RepID=UPI0014150B7E|nr:protein phosphatase 2C domain-containing protein [Streptomyces sp. GC420]NBM16726.1 integrase [Streptomyces sp. GC420]
MRLALGSWPATADGENEDFAAAGPGAAVLLDGAGVAGAPTGCVHGIAWFSSTLGAILLRTITSHPGWPLADCLADAIAEVRSLHGDTCDLTYRASPTSTVVAVRARDGMLEYLALGDSAVLLAQRNGDCAVVTDRRLDEASKELRGPVDQFPTGSPEHAAALAQYREALTGLRNRSGGFWIAGPDPEAARHAFTGSAPLASLASVSLLSDGATRLVDRFALASWAEVVALLDSADPDELIRQVREAEAADPEGRRWPRGKAQDDATALHWSFA